MQALITKHRADFSSYAKAFSTPIDTLYLSGYSIQAIKNITCVQTTSAVVSYKLSDAIFESSNSKIIGATVAGAICGVVN